ncbi:hypothetical protein K435DRAFT_796181 [Dendrothele bispora CBS 962.96]|uniref:Uncharacterized protein n=1 Tax=Dendrothele bispora (strain CBS 962.96) TaxID=1314807 RepID=A0A4S8M6P2_DENBC|nr:hypothetical protein K435DRAFT_796181 [Dendrothele bispora CBS 962.96]
MTIDKYKPKVNIQRFTSVPIICSKIHLVWRAWILHTNQRRAKMVLILSVLIIFDLQGGNLTDIVFICEDFYAGREFVLSVATHWACSLSSFIANFIATSMIGYKAWHYHRSIKKILNASHNSTTQVQRILILLVESGAFYCILWLALMVVVVGIIDINSIHSQSIVAVMPFCSALYPVLIIIIAADEKSYFLQGIQLKGKSGST